MAKKVNVIPATRQRFTAEPIITAKKRRVAGYARVSTDHEEQATSYDAQVRYYTEFIKGREDWEFVRIYTDEGISATSTAHREGFKQMVADALDGQIDLIVTKSVSRFARNTVDSLSTIRKLKEHGTEVYFEKENIWTLDAKGELLITIMSSLAQEESRSISENTTWGHRRRFQEGKASVAYSHFLGYDKDFKVNEEQAKTVRYIYRRYLSGLSCHAIAKELQTQGVTAPAGGKRWHPDTVQNILSNEKYMGDALLQKSYTADFLTKKQVKNNGEVPQYYVENHHEGIIDEATFRLVQAEMQRRNADGRFYSGVSIFSSKIVCGECGCYYGPKVWHSNDLYRRVIWRCNNKYRVKGNKNRCRTPNLTEDEIKAAFMKALDSLKKDKKEVLANMRLLQEATADTSKLESELELTGTELSALAEMTQASIDENARTAQDQEEYEANYGELARRYEEKKARYDELTGQISASKVNAEILAGFIRQFEKDWTGEFDDGLWGGMVDHLTVRAKGDIEVTFKGGLTVKVQIPRSP